MTDTVEEDRIRKLGEEYQRLNMLREAAFTAWSEAPDDKKVQARGDLSVATLRFNKVRDQYNDVLYPRWREPVPNFGGSDNDR